jgi:hypothetical protein
VGSSHVKRETAAGVKQERGVKRERGLDGYDDDEDDDDFVVPRSATAAVDVDLTEEVRAGPGGVLFSKS